MRNTLFLSVVLSFSLSCAPLDTASESKIIGGQTGPNNPEEPGIFSSALGFVLPGSETSCMAIRVGSNTYLTAAHCLNQGVSGSKFMFYATNTRNFSAYLTNVRIAEGYSAGLLGLDTKTLDLATFSIQFLVDEQKTFFDRFITIANRRVSDVAPGEKVNIVGFGCEDAASIPLLLNKCLKPNQRLYVKHAASEVGAPAEEGGLYFTLKSPLFSSSTDGFIGGGDSGGPVYDEKGQVIGINSNTAGLGVGTAIVGYSNHAWLGHAKAKDLVGSSLSSEPSLPYFKGNVTYTYETINGMIPPPSAPKDSYTGWVENGKRNGQGKMNYADGRTYEGSWLNDLKHGKGKSYFPENLPWVSYEGDFQNGLFNGQGHYVWRNGNKYDGPFKDGNPHGKGKKTFPDGSYEEGEWVDAKRQGLFILTDKNGKKWKCQFKDDVRQSITAM